jgi:hypothetical protein
VRDGVPIMLEDQARSLNADGDASAPTQAEPKGERPPASDTSR